MDIDKVDKNLVCKNESFNGLHYYGIDEDMFDLYGVKYDKKNNFFVRMPNDTAFEISDNIGGLNRCTTGGRVRFKTNSRYISIYAQFDKQIYSANCNPASMMGYVIYDDTNCRYISNIYPSKNDELELCITKKVSDGSMIDYTIFLPMYHDTLRYVKIGVEKDSIIIKGKKYKDILPILYYGSSITQGCCAARSDLTYQSIISKNNNIDFVNLGFSGNALAEDKMIEYLSKVKSSIFVCDYDHNAPTVEYLEKTHYKLYKTYRDNNPNTPIILLTRPFSIKKEDLYRRIEVVKNTYITGIENNDKNLYFINGSEIFGKYKNFCMVDESHPNTMGMYLIAEKISSIIDKIIGLE